MLTDTLLADTLLTTNLGTLASGGKTVVTLNTVPPATGTITNTASVGSGNADLNMVNNSVTVTTTVWPIPVLSIARLTNQFRISWPAPLSNFTLQSTANPASNNSWSNLTNKPAIVGGQSIVIQTNTGTNAFFRLKN
jgi:hypothetical protein